LGGGALENPEEGGARGCWGGAGKEKSARSHGKLGGQGRLTGGAAPRRPGLRKTLDPAGGRAFILQAFFAWLGIPKYGNCAALAGRAGRPGPKRGIGGGKGKKKRGAQGRAFSPFFKGRAFRGGWLVREI